MFRYVNLALIGVSFFALDAYAGPKKDQPAVKKSKLEVEGPSINSSRSINPINPSSNSSRQTTAPNMQKRPSASTNPSASTEIVQKQAKLEISDVPVLKNCSIVQLIDESNKGNIEAQNLLCREFEQRYNKLRSNVYLINTINLSQWGNDLLDRAKKDICLAHMILVVKKGVGFNQKQLETIVDSLEIKDKNSARILSYCCAFGIGVKQEKKREFLEKAFEAEDLLAHVYYGAMRFNCEEGEKNRNLPRNCLKLSRILMNQNQGNTWEVFI